MFDDATCNRVVADMMITQNICFRSPTSLVASGDKYMKLELVATNQQGVFTPKLHVYADAGACKDGTSPGVVAANIFDPAAKVCAPAQGVTAKNVAIVQFNIEPGSVPSDFRRIDVEWTDPGARRCGVDAGRDIQSHQHSSQRP